MFLYSETSRFGSRHEWANGKRGICSFVSTPVDVRNGVGSKGFTACSMAQEERDRHAVRKT